MGPQRATPPRISNCAHTELANMFGDHHNLNAPLSSACVCHIIVFFILTRGNKCSLRQQRWESQSASRQAARTMTAKATVMQAARYPTRPRQEEHAPTVITRSLVDRGGGIWDFLHCFVITRGQEERIPKTTSVVGTSFGLRSFSLSLCVFVFRFVEFVIAFPRL